MESLSPEEAFILSLIVIFLVLLGIAFRILSVIISKSAEGVSSCRMHLSFCHFNFEKCGQERLVIPVVVLQTIAANLGSMLTPIGNPQNLYLYNLSQMGILEFVLFMLPYTMVSGLLLVISLLLIRANTKRLL